MERSLAPQAFVNRHFSAPPGKVGLLYGERTVYSLAMLVASEILAGGDGLVMIDGANRLDPYLLARLARYQHRHPDDFLERTYITRAYTCYQLDISITDGLLSFLGRVGARIVIVYGLIDLFDDDQVPAGDAADILRRIRQTFVHLKANGISTLLVSSAPRFRLKEREKLFAQMSAMADVRYRLEKRDDSHHIILEETLHGKDHTDGHHAHPIRGRQLVAIPAGAAERGPGRV
jgi:hypothetical protein